MLFLLDQIRFDIDSATKPEDWHKLAKRIVKDAYLLRDQCLCCLLPRIEFEGKKWYDDVCNDKYKCEKLRLTKILNDYGNTIFPRRYKHEGTGRC
jgi:hypothetical protein